MEAKKLIEAVVNGADASEAVKSLFESDIEEVKTAILDVMDKAFHGRATGWSKLIPAVQKKVHFDQATLNKAIQELVKEEKLEQSGVIFSLPR